MGTIEKPTIRNRAGRPTINNPKDQTTRTNELRQRDQDNGTIRFEARITADVMANITTAVNLSGQKLSNPDSLAWMASQLVGTGWGAARVRTLSTDPIRSKGGEWVESQYNDEIHHHLNLFDRYHCGGLPDIELFWRPARNDINHGPKPAYYWLNLHTKLVKESYSGHAFFVDKYPTLEDAKQAAIHYTRQAILDTHIHTLQAMAVLADLYPKRG